HQLARPPLLYRMDGKAFHCAGDEKLTEFLELVPARDSRWKRRTKPDRLRSYRLPLGLYLKLDNLNPGHAIINRAVAASYCHPASCSPSTVTLSRFLPTRCSLPKAHDEWRAGLLVDR